ncbi:MAG: monoamine oxidase [Gammaproteobacteria bacterium]
MRYNIKDTNILIIGGGLSGLVAAWQLEKSGIDTILLEARNRFGGRILSAGVDKSQVCDLGPSWFWPGQPLIASLLDQFEIPHFSQYDRGDVLFQALNGTAHRNPGPSPMSGALRIKGGMTELVEKIVAKIDPSHLLMEHPVTKLCLDGKIIRIEVTTPAGTELINANQVAIAIPPRLATDLLFCPELPGQAQKALTSTPTWMAGHAKFFAIYPEPFWKQQGLCGSVFSQTGPLAEIHDASPEGVKTSGLFGFSRLDANTRKKIGREEFTSQAIKQLVALFGEQAKHPETIYFQDWFLEPFTAAGLDIIPPHRHPDYGLKIHLGDSWNNRLHFISTETAFINGGLVEGALEAGLGFAQSVFESKK